jgi:hypothetical protein
MLTGVSRRRDPRSRRQPSATSPLMTVPLDIRRSLLRQYGNFALAYSVTFQPGLEHFGDESGFLSYKTVGSTALVLSNPIAAPDKRRTLINRFMEEKGDLCFWQISRPVAEILASLGFSINEIGTESHINLANYNFTGSAPAKRNLRRAYNRTLDRGYTTRECPVASLNLKELEAVSVKWRQTRCVKSREITFLVRPAVLEDEAKVLHLRPGRPAKGLRLFRPRVRRRRGGWVFVLDQTPPARNRPLGGLCADALCDGILSARGEKILISRVVSTR